MSGHLFVDESKRNGLVMVSVLVPNRDVRDARSAVQRLLLPGQRRIHFKSEKLARKKQIMQVISDLPLSGTAYVCHPGQDELDGRRACLGRMVEDYGHTERMVIELDESLVQHDKRALFDATAKTGSETTYHHMRAHEECLLALPDAIAWCWAANGQWRSSVEHMLRVVDFGS